MSVDPGQFRAVAEEIATRRLLFGDGTAQTTAAGAAVASPILGAAKLNTETKSNDIVLADDLQLVITGITPGFFAFDARLRISQGANAGGFRYAFRTGPGNFSGNSSSNVSSYFRTGAGADIIPNALAIVFDNTPSALIWTNPIANATGRAYFRGFVEIPVGTDELALQWAQGVSVASNTGISQGSVMWLTKIADLP